MKLTGLINYVGIKWTHGSGVLTFRVKRIKPMSFINHRADRIIRRAALRKLQLHHVLNRLLVSPFLLLLVKLP